MSETGVKSRSAAFTLLSGVLDKGQMLDQMMASQESFAHLSPQDRGFVHMLVATTLRRLGQLDALILRAMTQGKAPEPVRLAHVLRLGLTQILFMDVPPHATVDTSVMLAEKQGLGRQKGLVNAVLRNLVEMGPTWLAERNDPLSNIPHWLQQLWISDYGIDGAKDIAQSSLSEAAIDISAKESDMQMHWANTLGGKVLPTGSVRLPNDAGSIPTLPGFSDGMWWVQDAAAALPVKILGDDLSGISILDMCAAPGGKTMQLASLGAQVTALDRSHNRLKVLTENLQRLRLEKNVAVECGDGAMWGTKDPFDVVLLDAPCSATGTLRRHPDVMHIKAPRDIERLQDTQHRLLENATNLVKEGGTLIYCVCSLQKSEGEYQIDRFLNAHPNFQRAPITAPEIGDIENVISEQGDIRVLPHHLAAYGGIDGFYVARLTKSS